MVVVWNTVNVSKGGEVTVLAKAHTDADIYTMKVTFFDNTRYHTRVLSSKMFFYLKLQEKNQAP